MLRRSIRRSLTEFARLCGFEPATHHQLLIAELEKVARGETPRLAVFMPPGSAKSTYGSPARTWSALYQQRPAPEEGDYFKAEWKEQRVIFHPVRAIRSPWNVKNEQRSKARFSNDRRAPD